MSTKDSFGGIFMKKFLIASLFLVFFLLLGCQNQADKNIVENQQEKDDAEIDDNQRTLDNIDGEIEIFEFKEAVRTSNLIAQVKIIESVEEIDGPTPKTMYRATLIESLKGTSDAKEIFVLQQGNSDFVFRDNPLFKKGENYLLFLMETADLDIEDSYWILGEETGIYQLLDESIAVKWAVKEDELEKIEIVDKEIISFAEKNTELSLDGREIQVLKQDELKKLIKNVSSSIK